MKVIILAGGSGTRLWPLSRTNFPKQFIKLKNKTCSIFQMTVERSRRLVDLSQLYIVTNADHKLLILSQTEELGLKFNESNILIEPLGRNTLPAILYGVKEIQKQGNDLTVVFPSDHIINDDLNFLNTIQKSRTIAQEYLVTYGVKPCQPHTGYGYIKPGEPLDEGYRVAEFKEKPNEKTAQAYVEKGYLWNSGMFMFRTDIFTEEVKQYCPDVYQAFSAKDISEVYENTPAISIDYGLMEKSSRVAVIPLDIKWSDLGSFDTFYDEFPPDEKGNITFNSSILIEATNNLVYTGKDKVAALVGVKDLIVVDERDALLICQKNQSQKVKEVVARLKNAGDSRADTHLITYRPWGSYTILEKGPFYKVRRITVLPGRKLSYQLHHHRKSSHWVVVRGTAKVTIEGTEMLVRRGESTFVPGGKKHRLENPDKALLEVIEVQLGEYLEEDDIIRFDDDFGQVII